MRSIVLPGWGLVATGDRRGLGVAVVALVGILVLVLIGLPYADGTAVSLVFLAGAALAIGWAGQALLAWRRAVRRRELLDLPTDDGGAMSVLWLAPVVVVAATVFWSFSGAGASPDARAAAYAESWWRGRAEPAAAGFAPPLDAAVLDEAWARQDARLRNLLVTAAAETGASGGIDPDRPFESIRFTEEAVGASPTTRTVRMDIVKRVLVRDTVLGVVATTSLELVPVADVGVIELRLEELPGPIPALPASTSWRIVRVVALGETIPG